MAKQSGLGDNLYVAGYNVSGDIGSIGSVKGGPALLEVTGIDKSGTERVGGLRDGSMEYTAYFNKAAGQAHDVFSALPTSDDVVTYFRGTTIGNSAACLVAKQIGYDGERGDDGSLTFKVEAQANGYGIEWGEQLTDGVRTDSTGTSGSAYDYGSSTAYGLQAYFQVFSVTGTSVIITVEHSADNVSWSTLATWSGVSALGATRIAATGTVNRYLRVTTAGTFTDAQFAVAAVRNETEVTF